MEFKLHKNYEKQKKEDELMWKEWLNNENSEELEKLASFVVLNFPVGSNFGIDLNMWKTGEKFKGVKMIPPGFHFIRCKVEDELSYQRQKQEATMTSSITTSVIGIFVIFKKEQIMIRNYCAEREEFDFLDDELTTKNLELSIKNHELDRELGVYPISTFEVWKRLTSFISKKTIDRCAPKYNQRLCTKYNFILSQSKRNIRSNDATHDDQRSCDDNINIEKKDDDDDDDDGDERMSIAYYDFKFLEIPKRWLPQSCKTGAEITHHSMDKSSLLHHLLNTKYNNNENELISEFQFSFICFWIAENYDAFEFWKSFISMMCCCDDAFSEKQELFLNFLLILTDQLQCLPDDFFVDPISSSNFLIPSFENFFEIITFCDSPKLQKVDRAFFDLKNMMQMKFHRSFDLDDDRHLSDATVVYFDE